jgi:hypothetical protein
VSVLVGHGADAGPMLGAANPRVASVRSGMTRPVPQGGGVDGRAVVMGCDEPLARGGWGSGEGWRGLMWVHIGLAGGHFEMVGFAGGGLAGRGGCHTLVTSGAKHGGTQGDTLRRFLQVGGTGGTRWDG